MKWTYDKVRRYAECQRKRARRKGCRACGKTVSSLELLGSPPLSRMVRDGYGVERVKAAITSRGWYCRSCSRGSQKERGQREKKKKQQQQQLPCPTSDEVEVSSSVEDKRVWSDERKFEYCYEAEGLVQTARAHECWEEGPLRDGVLEIMRGPI